MVENVVVEAQPLAVNWPLRLAQQAFAAVLDRRDEHAGSFAAASRRQGARQALSALSIDDHGPLERWLALQLITITSDGACDALAALSSVDALLAVAVRMQLARTDAEFIRPAKRWHAVGTRACPCCSTNLASRENAGLVAADFYPARARRRVRA